MGDPDEDAVFAEPDKPASERAVDNGSCDSAEPTEPCIDSHGARICPVDSGGDWLGDHSALCEPTLEQGLLFHYGPENYDDPVEVEKYVTPPGMEHEDCVYVKSANDAEIFLGDYHARMRPGSHHLIVYAVNSADVTVPFGEPATCSQAGAIGQRWLLGSQDPTIDVSPEGTDPALGIEPPEPGDPDYGLGTRLPADQVLRINMHYINTTDKPVLREGWLSLDRKNEEDVVTMVDMLTLFQYGINVPPLSMGVKTQMATCTASTDRYVGLFTGHMHENGQRITVWHDTGAGEPSVVYETFDWEDPGNLVYNDRLENPVSDSNRKSHGGTSGYLQVKAGESINFECEFDNPEDRTVGFGLGGKDQMCIIFGYYYPSDGNVWDCTCTGSSCN